jgi:hypothetical protein
MRKVTIRKGGQTSAHLLWEDRFADHKVYFYKNLVLSNLAECFEPEVFLYYSL